MRLLLITVFGVGGATILGAVCGIVFKNSVHKFKDIVLSYSYGIIMAATVYGLITPSLEYGGQYGIIITICGILLGAVCMGIIDIVAQHLIFNKGSSDGSDEKIKAFLLVIAMAVHNFPEGVAAGVGFGAGNIKEALLIAFGIAVHNIPEGMVIIGPMLSARISSKNTFICAVITGAFEIVGALAGYFAAGIANVILPVALAFAGGIMLYVFFDELLSKEICCTANGKLSQKKIIFASIMGFCTMLISDMILKYFL